MSARRRDSVILCLGGGLEGRPVLHSYTLGYLKRGDQMSWEKIAQNVLSQHIFCQNYVVCTYIICTVERSGTEICSNSVIFQKLAKLTTDKLVT
jgi:hypothetical protein